MVKHHSKYSIAQRESGAAEHLYYSRHKQIQIPNKMKRIFFVAALAIVAIGGANAATNYYALNSNTAVPCDVSGIATCSSEIGSSQAYLTPAEDGPQTDPQNVNGLFYDPS